eukprot:Skav218707  [mRNA]  locus=scaffold1346:436844:438519:- [translate_table: standard]
MTHAMRGIELPESRGQSFEPSVTTLGGRHQRSEHDADWQQVQQIELEIPNRLKRLGKILENMDVIEDEVLRVTPAYRCFEQRAIAFHGSEVSEDFYEKSCKSSKIETFWSHSSGGARWKLGLFGSPKKKLITLKVICNRARGESWAVCIWVLALAAAVLRTIVDIHNFDDRIRASYAFVKWSSCLSLLVEWLLIFFLRPETSVFLDQICIKQQDNAMKANTILSLAGIMKRSDKMLVLWDPTWTENLWCLVELAAFLKSRQNPEQQLIIRPIFLEPFSLVVSLTAIGAIVTCLPMESDRSSSTILLPPLSFLTQHFLPFLLCALIAAYAGVSALRSYFRSVESMQQRLLSISFDDTRCSCCDRNHVSPSGKPMLCDRKVFGHCISHWFGGQDAFEDILRTEVRKRMAIGLRESLSSFACYSHIANTVLKGFVGLALIEEFSVLFIDVKLGEYGYEHNIIYHISTC